MTTEQPERASKYDKNELRKIAEDIDGFLDEHQHKELLRFVAVGSVDDGKSTLIGRLLHDADQVFEDQLEDARRGNTDDGQEIDFALLTDGLRAEREQGITIDVAYRYFNTTRRKFIIADTPGHVQYTRNMATGASTADVAIILIDARLGVQQQSRRHAYIASLLGIPHLTVCINKMDLKEYQQDVFEDIKETFQRFASRLSFQDITYLPISAKFGDNVVNRSEHTPWYMGPTLMAHLEEVPLTHTRNLTDFRLPVQYVLRPNQDFRGFAGQISSGSIKVGDPITVMPSGKETHVASIETFDGQLQEAFAPMSVTLCLQDEVDVSRGDMLVHSERKPTSARAFDAMLVWMNETALDPRKAYLLKHTSQTVKAEVAQIYWKSNPNNLEQEETTQLVLNEIGKVRFQCHRPLFFDDYRKNRATGAFILIDYLTNETLAAGMIQGTDTSQEVDTLHDAKTAAQRWQQFNDGLWVDPTLGLRLDITQMRFPKGYLSQLSPDMDKALMAMIHLEHGQIANPDEGRMVGHYWLRSPNQAPKAELRQLIEASYNQVKQFSADIHSATIKPPTAARFRHMLLVGIGGSALGPQWLNDALRAHDAPMQGHFLDNTDPDGFARIFAQLGDQLAETLVLIVSKSGGTQETRNGMLHAQAAFAHKGLDFHKHAVAVTGEGSPLEAVAKSEGWLAIFPMWDWVGGRTSMFSAVGLLPAALLGIDIDGLRLGASHMDACTRRMAWRNNPAALLAACWHRATRGKGERTMYLLPYKDRLLLFARYAQQLIMESLGKRLNRKGDIVHQGIAVYGNKGSTDQHALIQQLREGPDDFFATFIEVLRDHVGDAPPDPFVEEDVTSGDYLLGFLLGTREAFREAGRLAMTLTLPDVSAHSIGMLVALYERAVGIYAELIDINAYHQPGVEAGKRAATAVIELQRKALAYLREHHETPFRLLQLAEALDIQEQIDALFYVLEHLAHNHRLTRTGDDPSRCTYQIR